MRASLQDVIALARAAHAGQTDKAGAPYIEHPLRVMRSLPEEDATARMAAVLHDVLEDTTVTAEHLRTRGVPEEVVEAVVLLSHKPGETNDAYWERLSQHSLARRVKLADIADNSDEARLAKLPGPTAARLRRKYARARAALQEGRGEPGPR